MIRHYEKIYNSTGSDKKLDLSGVRKDNIDRYRWSIKRLHGKVLDVGAGDGFGASMMIEKGLDVTCLEIQDKAIEKIKQLPVKWIKGIAEGMPFEREFDSVHCGHTLEHVEDLGMALREIKRVAKKTVVVSVPIKGGVNKVHLREFENSEEVESILSKYFKIIESETFRGFTKKGKPKVSLVIVCKNE